MMPASAPSPQAKLLHEAFESRLARGYALLAESSFQPAMLEFEAAHILGQRYTWRHLRSHVALLRWGWQAHRPSEIAGQIGRMVGAALFTWAWVPRGNPGSTRVGAFRTQPVPAELAKLLDASGT